MSKAITFFRNRQQETGQTYEFEIEDSARRYQIFVYSRKALEETLVRSRQLRGGSGKAEVDKIRQALLQSGGGVIASTYEENRERALVIFPVASDGKAACGTFGLLLPGHPSLSLETLSENSIYFPQGSHALVPVDKEAEDSLRGLQKYVGFLPPDLESLVFHAIRDPGLDLRVGRLEAVALKGTAGSGVAQTGRAGSVEPWYKRWIKQPVPVWPVAAIALGLMLTVNSIFLYSILHSVDGSILVSSKNGHGDQGGNGDKTDSTAPEQKIFAVIQAIRGKSSNPSFVALSQGHFSKVKNEADVKKVLAQEGDGRLLVRGLLKLEALRLDPTAAGSLFGAADNYTDLNNFYKGRELDAGSREVLAALACAAFPSPGLPNTASAASVLFADVDQSCKNFPLDKAAPGLEKLLELVQEAD